jgi:hypothetical protein
MVKSSKDDKVEVDDLNNIELEFDGGETKLRIDGINNSIQKLTAALETGSKAIDDFSPGLFSSWDNFSKKFLSTISNDIKVFETKMNQAQYSDKPDLTSNIKKLEQASNNLSLSLASKKNIDQKFCQEVMNLIKSIGTQIHSEKKQYGPH